ncbi:hypothetical protein F4778DRAFT_444306 [Xylariomycetidae sp. FL2044]|nr:hypothetical protein F4778DRAFT_444306 [Xylariomycetidae sp. FL2044]
MDDNEDATVAMAEAMGFSSFGAQNPPNKRRKFNPHADAVIASSTTSSNASPRNFDVPHASATGSNTTSLGIRMRNEDEVHLDIGEDEPQVSSSEGVQAHVVGEGDDSGCANLIPQYIDTQYPPATQGFAGEDTQSKIDTLGAFKRPAEGQSALSHSNGRGGPANKGGAYGQTKMGNRVKQGNPWWEDYYDPSSNTNPWERLEQSQGLEPRGSWMTWEEAKR